MRYLLRSLPALLLLFCSCRKDPPLWEIRNLNGNSISVIGHGGMGAAYRFPGNTMESLTDAIRIGADGVEMDVQLTADGTLVLFHHNSLDESTSCNGSVEQKNWSDIKGCAYTEKLLTRPRLISAGEFFDQPEARLGKLFVFDLKQTDTTLAFSRRYASALIAFIQKYDIAGFCLLESSQIYLLKMLAEQNPALKLFLYTDSFETGLAYSKDVNLYGITMDMAKITKEEIVKAHSSNLRVAIFNARTERLNAMAVQMSPDYIQTDRVEHLLQMLKK